MLTSRTPGRHNLAGAAPFAIVLFVAVAALVVEPDFYDPSNLRNVVRGAAFLAVVSLGQLMVIIVRGLDLSVGAVITATLLVVIEVSRTGQRGTAHAIVAVVIMALAVGALNAALVVWRRVPAILATLATLVLVENVSLWLTDGQSRGRVPSLLRPLGTGTFGPIPVPVIVAGIATVAVGFLLNRTSFGRSMYAVGANPEASHLAGLPRRRVASLAFVASSLLAMVTGLMLAGDVGFYDRTIGTGFELDSIAAVILGGASFAGGSGTVVATLAPVVGLAALDNLLLISGVTSPVQLIGKGLVLLVAVAASGWLLTRPPAPSPVEPSESHSK